MHWAGIHPLCWPSTRSTLGVSWFSAQRHTSLRKLHPASTHKPHISGEAPSQFGTPGGSGGWGEGRRRWTMGSLPLGGLDLGSNTGHSKLHQWFCWPRSKYPSWDYWGRVRIYSPFSKFCRQQSQPCAGYGACQLASLFQYGVRVRLLKAILKVDLKVDKKPVSL